MDDRRVLIVDVTHLFYKYAFGGASGLSCALNIDGVMQMVDTTLPTYVIKQIHRWSQGGYYPTVVCFDGVGCGRARKAYFTSHDVSGQKVEYKADRKIQSGTFYQGVNITMNLLRQGGVFCLQLEHYEADDLVKAAVDRAKVDFPGMPIDVVTGDRDLVPLVDEQVSVFLYSVKTTWAESKELEKRHYVQLRPSNYQAYLEGLSEYKTLSVPYNTLLLVKLLRGDKSDSVPGYPKFTPTKYRKLVEELQCSGCDMEGLFRYDNPVSTICYRGTEEPIPEEIMDSVPREQKMIKFSDPLALINICNVLSNYVDDDIIQHVQTVYRGINLNTVFVDVPEGLKRRPAVLTQPVRGYDAGYLQQAVSIVKINLPMF